MIFFFFFNDTATTEIYTLSLHDALPICLNTKKTYAYALKNFFVYLESKKICYKEVSFDNFVDFIRWMKTRSEEHTSELQSPNCISYAVFCLKKKKNKKINLILLSFVTE